MRFYSIQIDSIHLTADGTAGGEKCRLAVAGVEELLQTVTGVALPTIGGGVVTQLAPFSSGKRFSVAVETLMKNQWDALLVLINNALETDSGFTVEGFGDTGNFSVTVKPFPVKPFSAANFRNGRIRGVNLEFITV